MNDYSTSKFTTKILKKTTVILKLNGYSFSKFTTNIYKKTTVQLSLKKLEVASVFITEKNIIKPTNIKNGLNRNQMYYSD